MTELHPFSPQTMPDEAMCRVCGLHRDSHDDAEWDLAEIRKALAGSGYRFLVSRERLANLVRLLDHATGNAAVPGRCAEYAYPGDTSENVRCILAKGHGGNHEIAPSQEAGK